jgi:hypothetical protein
MHCSLILISFSGNIQHISNSLQMPHNTTSSHSLAMPQKLTSQTNNQITDDNVQIPYIYNTLDRFYQAASTTTTLHT